MDSVPLVPVTVARIRIPVPIEAIGPLLGILLVAAVMASFYYQRRDWRRWGLPALGALVVAGLAFSVPRWLAAGAGSSLLLPLILEPLVGDLLLVWAALAVWGLRRRVDVAGVALAVVLYAACRPPVGALLMGLPLEWRWFVLSAVGTACFLGMLAVLGMWVRPAWAGVLAGVVAGFLLRALAGSLLNAALLPPGLAGGGASVLLTSAAWALARGLVAGGLFALAVGLLKPEQAP